MSRRKRDTGPDLFALTCCECGVQLWRTTTGFLACPFGHGKLIEQQDEPPEVDEASLFDPLELEAP